MTNPISITVIDAFTDQPFAGNPAAVCLLDRPAPEVWMARVAGEMNLSETAFLFPEGAGYRLRWFTPKLEVDLCGHATLAAAHLLWSEGHLAESEPARFETKSGPLTARRVDGSIALDFPALPCKEAGISPSVIDAIGTRADAIRGVGISTFDWLIELATERHVDFLLPNMPVLAEIPVRGIIVTAPSRRPGVDFVSRFFAPKSGVPEDPVTGSAHCVLGPYWAQRLGKRDMVGYQASRRGGTVRVRLVGNDRVELIGQAVTMLRSTLLHGSESVGEVSSVG